MTLLRTEYTTLPGGWRATRTVCGECGRGLSSPQEWSDCRRTHVSAIPDWAVVERTTYSVSEEPTR